MIATALLLVLLAVASVTDVRRHTIYNWTTYPGIATALILNGAGSALTAATNIEGRQLESFGWIGIGESFFGFVLCGFLLLVCFVFLKVGGGDVKLIAMLGAFLGVEKGVEAMLWTFVLGGCVGLIVLIWRVGAWRLVSRVLRQVLWTLRLGRWSPLAPEERAQLQPPLFLAPCAQAAVAIVQFSLLEFLGI